MQYLRIPEGLFVTSTVGDQSADFYNEKCRDLDISIQVLDGFEAPPNLTNVSVGSEAHSMWRWSFWLERILVRRLTLICKADPKLICPSIVRDYYRLINNQIFFVPHTTGRVGRLYDAYKNHPSLTLDAAAEIEGNYPDPTGEAGRDTVKAALNEGEHLLLQICMYMEHRARLSILKGAVDELCRQGSAAQVEAVSEGLPASFISALEQIEKMPTFWKYPVFWQVFLWGWGGFLLTDDRENELAMVAAEAGLTLDEAEHALSVYDLLFPIESNSWIQKMPTAAYEFVKMVPWPFAGLGAYRRMRVYGWKSHTERPGSGYTASDLARRHNNAYELLAWGEKYMPR